MDPKNIIAQLMIQEQKVLQFQMKLKEDQKMNTLQKAKSLQIIKTNEIQVQEKNTFIPLLKPSTTFCVGIQNQILPQYERDNYQQFTIKQTTSHLFWRPTPTSKLTITEPHTITGSLTAFKNKYTLTIKQRYIEYKPIGKFINTQNRYMTWIRKPDTKILQIKTKIKNTQKIINSLKYEIVKNNLHKLNEKVAEKIRNLREITGKEKGFANKFALIHSKYMKIKKMYEDNDSQIRKKLDAIDKSDNKGGLLTKYLINELYILIGQFSKYRQNVHNTNKELSKKQEIKNKQYRKEKDYNQANEIICKSKIAAYSEKEKLCDNNLKKLENRWDLTEKQYTAMKNNISQTKEKLTKKREKVQSQLNEYYKQLEDALRNKLH
jgi:hypothetical protein